MWFCCNVIHIGDNGIQDASKICELSHLFDTRVDTLTKKMRLKKNTLSSFEQQETEQHC